MLPEDPFKYIPPTEEMKPHFEAVADAVTYVYHVLLKECPPSAERTLAVRDLQRTRMWANAAISFEGQKIQT